MPGVVRAFGALAGDEHQHIGGGAKLRRSLLAPLRPGCGDEVVRKTFGAYGLRVNLFPDNTMPFTPTDKYTDTAVDAQYQYITQENTITGQFTHIHEDQNYRANTGYTSLLWSF